MNQITPKPICLEAVSLYGTGMSMNDIARKLNIGRHAVANALRRYHTAKRTRRESWALRRKHPFNESFFKHIDTEEKAYWLGFISADGYVNEPNRALTILLGRVDRSHLELLNAAMGGCSPVADAGYRKNGKFYPTSNINFFSSGLLDDLKSHGVGTRKSLVIRPWAGSPELMRHYWRGVVDGDGCIHKRKNGYWSVSMVGSPWMADGFLAFVHSQTGADGSRYIKGKIVHAAFGGIGLPKLVATLLYGDATIALDRKHLLAKELMSVTPKREYGDYHDWSHITAERLTELRAVLPSWSAVARRLNLVHIGDIHRLRCVVGLLPRRRRKRPT